MNDKEIPSPERIWIAPITFAARSSNALFYDEAEREPSDVEYVRADLLAGPIFLPKSSVPHQPDSEVAEAFREGVEIAITIVRRNEYDSRSSLEGACPECSNFPDRPSTAQVWRDRDRVGHKPTCKHGAAAQKAIVSLTAITQALALAHSRGIAEGIERTSRMVCQYCDDPAEWAKAIPDPYPHAGVGRLEHLPLSGQGSGRGCAAWAIRGLSPDPNYISSVRKEVWDAAINIASDHRLGSTTNLASYVNNPKHGPSEFIYGAAAVMQQDITNELIAARDK